MKNENTIRKKNKILLKKDINKNYLPKFIKGSLKLQNCASSKNIARKNKLNENKLNISSIDKQIPNYNEIFKNNMPNNTEELPIINYHDIESYGRGEYSTIKIKKPDHQLINKQKNSDIKTLVKKMILKIDDIKQLEQHIQSKHNILFEKLRPRSKFIERAEKKLNEYLFPNKLNNDIDYILNQILKIKTKELEIKNFDDSSIIFNDILEYNYFIDEMKKNMLGNVLNTKILDDAFNFDENFYGDVGYKIRNLTKIYKLDDIESQISSIKGSLPTKKTFFSQDSNYVYSEGNNIIGESQYIPNKLIHKEANIKIKLSHKDVQKYKSDNAYENSYLINLFKKRSNRKEISQSVNKIEITNEQEKIDKNLIKKNLYQQMFNKKHKKEINISII